MWPFLGAASQLAKFPVHAGKGTTETSRAPDTHDCAPVGQQRGTCPANIFFVSDGDNLLNPKGVAGSMVVLRAAAFHTNHGQAMTRSRR